MTNNRLVLFLALITLIAGCATVPPRQMLPTFSIGGTTYLPLIRLCESRGIDWQYDTFSRVVNLKKGAHDIRLRVGDELVLVDGRTTNIRYPVQLHQGEVVVPQRFKEQVVDILFKELKEPYKPAKPALLSSRIRKIVIDAGHGGVDPGAIGRTGLREKELNLEVAMRLRRILESYGLNVVLTRSADRTLALPSRVGIANSAKGDLFISIHGNANRSRSLSGVEVYYLRPSANDSARALFAAKNSALDLDPVCFASNSLDLKATLWDMIFTGNRAESIELARSICHAMQTGLDAKILGIKNAGFFVLKGARMPAILIEIGFLSNYDEERRLKDGSYRQKISEGIAAGVRDYINEFQSFDYAQD